MISDNVYKYEPPSFEMIEAAVSGEACAVNGILQHYEKYVLCLSNRYSFGPSGKIHTVIDPELKNRLETKLINRILKFRVS